jgi:hypothetical protein
MVKKLPPNTAVQPDAAGAASTWARFTRKLRSACGMGGLSHSSSSDSHTKARPDLWGAASQFAGACRLPPALPPHTPASGAADSYPLGRSISRDESRTSVCEKLYGILEM